MAARASAITCASACRTTRAPSSPPHALGLYHLLKDCDTRYIGAIWDAAHEALEGMEPEPALDVLEGFLYIVNLKNGFWQRTTVRKRPRRVEDLLDFRHTGPSGLASASWIN